MAFGSPNLKLLIATMVMFIAHIQLSKPETTVRYLYGGYRFNNTLLIDYYFCCNAEGSSLQVFVNGLSAGGFSSSESGSVQTGYYDTFNYSTAVISVNDILGGNYRYDSIIVVSVKAANHVDVRCRGRLGSASANNSGGIVNQNNIIGNRSAEDESGQLMIQQLFSGQVVQGSMTHGFICGVQRAFQTWGIENDDNSFSFSDGNNIGDTIPSPTGSLSTVYHLAFLCAREPFQIVTIMLLTGGNLNSDVTCAAGRYRASISIADLTNPTTSTASATTSLSEELSSSTIPYKSYPTSSTQQKSSPPSVNEPQEGVPTTLVVGVVTGVLVAFGVASFAFVVVLLICMSVKKNGVKPNSCDQNDELYVFKEKPSLRKEHEEMKPSLGKEHELV